MKKILLFVFVAFWVLIPFYSYAQDEKRMAVLDFESTNRISNWWSSYEWGSNFKPGEAIAAALTSRLAKSSKFIIVEREQLDSVLKEQQLGESGAISPETASDTGRLLGARYLVTGIVTEFNLTNRGSEGRVRVPISGFGLGLGGRSNSHVRVSCEAKVIDTVTGAIVYTASARKDVSVGSGGLGGFYKGYALAGRGGELPSSALGNGLYEVADSLANQIESGNFKEVAVSPKLEGYVIAVDGDKAFLNLSTSDRVVRNMIFKISCSKSINDPKTGRSRTITKTIGEVKVLDVGEDSCECQILEGKGDIQEGDRAVKK